MDARQETRTKLVLLGTGTPNADPDRSGPAVAVVVNHTPYLVDFGPGVVRRAAAAHRLGIAGLAVDRLSRAFVTHLHSDHTAGYPDLILTPWVLERDVPLQVYGPAGLRAMTEHLLAAYREDIRERTQGLEPVNVTGHLVQVNEIEPGIVYEDGDVQIEALAANHGAWPAFSYRFFTQDRTIVISGDTAPYEGMAEAYAGCDLLVHEVYSAAGLARRPPEWQRYHQQVHTSTTELAAVAQAARPKLLVLTHQLFWEVTEDELLAEIRAGYYGRVVSGRDLDVF